MINHEDKQAGWSYVIPTSDVLQTTSFVIAASDNQFASFALGQLDFKSVQS